jgi:hypothetical protein
MCIAALAIAIVATAGGGAAVMHESNAAISGRDLMDPEKRQLDSVQKDCLYRVTLSFTSVVHVHSGNVQDKEAEVETPYVTGSAKHRQRSATRA